MPNIHPIVIHFPIVLLLASFACRLISFFYDHDYFNKTSKWALLLGTISLGLSALTGWLGHKTVSHSESSYALIEQHQTLGFISLGVFVTLVLLDLVPLQKKVLVPLVLLTNILGLVFLLWGSHLGGRLVYELGVGVQAVDHTNITEDTEFDAEFERILLE